MRESWQRRGAQLQGWGKEVPVREGVNYGLKWALWAASIESACARRRAGEYLAGTEPDKDNRRGCGNGWENSPVSGVLS